MPDHTRAKRQLQFAFPTNTEEYAPWVAIYGLLAPYGECQCGCGQPTPVAKETNKLNGRRKGSPVRYLHSHNTRPFVGAPNQRLQDKARIAVGRLIQSGKLPRADALICAHCQLVCAAEYHHFNGYEPEHWLDVVPLCIPCHKKAHGHLGGSRP